MKLEHGATVKDQNGKTLGKVDHLLRNLSTGEIRKFIVRRKGQEKDLLISTKDVMEVTEGKVKLNVPLEELEQR